MSLATFVASLLPRLNRNDILEDLNITKNEFTNIVLPTYKEASEYFSENKLASKEVEELVKLFNRHYNSQVRNPEKLFVSELYRALLNVSDNVLVLEKQLTSVLESQTITSAITAKKANLIKATEHMYVISRFATEFLIIIYKYETARVNNEKAEFSPFTLNKIMPNIHIFAKLLELYSKDSRDFERQLTNVPEVVISEDSYEMLKSLFDKENLDPTDSAVVQGFVGNPIYHLGMVVAEWQAERYKSNKEKKRLLEIKLLNLKMAKENKRDPKLDKEIAYLEGRIEALDYKLTKMERDVEHV